MSCPRHNIVATESDKIPPQCPFSKKTETTQSKIPPQCPFLASPPMRSPGSLLHSSSVKDADFSLLVLIEQSSGPFTSRDLVDIKEGNTISKKYQASVILLPLPQLLLAICCLSFLFNFLNLRLEQSVGFS